MLNKDEHGGLLNIINGKATTIISKVHPIHAKLEEAYRNEHGSPVYIRKELSNMKMQQKKDRLKSKELEDDEQDES